MKIIDDIRKSRPGLSENTYKTYMFNLKGIRKCMNLNPEDLDSVSFLKNYDKTIKCIEDNTDSLSSVKSKLTAVVVALSSEEKVDKNLVDKYKKYMDTTAKKYNSFVEKNLKSDKQEKNWIEYSSVIDVCNKLKKDYERLRKKVKNQGGIEKLYDSQFKLLQGYVMLRLQLQFPVRNDTAHMKVLSPNEYNKIQEKERMKNNYLVVHSKDKKVLHINSYKTAKRLGPRQYQIPKPINRLLNQWLKMNKSGYLFVKPNKRIEPVTEKDVSRLFTQLFKIYYPDKNISTSMLRHILISHDRRNDPTIEEQKKKNKQIEDKYLHSKQLNDQYNKK
jgi:hypothetical protein